MVASVASSTPLKAPCHPAWAAPMTPACRSANRIMPQSAPVTPSATPRKAVAWASQRGRSPLQGAVTARHSGEWIW